MYGKLFGFEMQENVTPSLKCSSTTESYGGSYRLKAGLITADELVFAGETMMVVGNSYLNSESANIYYWSMTPSRFSYGDANVWIETEGLGNSLVHDVDGGLRPVINVKADNGFTSGDGTASNPYVIS